jgi:ATP-dependent RNA helicase DeaD
MTSWGSGPEGVLLARGGRGGEILIFAGCKKKKSNLRKEESGMSRFVELGVEERIARGLEELGYEEAMAVQEAVIPLLLEPGSGDVIALAQTGTGKTAAYGIPILQKTEVCERYPQSLVLCPTRELCLQIAGDLQDYSKYIEDLTVLPVYGGSSIESQIRTLKRGVHIVVATPGRLVDLLNRRTVDLGKIRNVILDEADEMLNMGFSESLNEILSKVPSERKMLLFSATMPQGIASITRKYMREPKEVVIGKKNEGNRNIRHVYYMVRAQDKYLALKRIADYYPNIYGIIFCRTRKETQEVAESLIKDGYNADSLHGELSQGQRDNVMQKFRIRNLQLLVATDVAARGLDVDDLTHVIHYGLPDEVEAYTHRSGRTARAGKTGMSIAICHTKEKGKIRNIERGLNKPFEEGKMPSGQSICEKQLLNLVDRLEKVEVKEEEIAELMPVIYRKLDWLDKEEIIKRVMWLEFNRMIAYYRRQSPVSLAPPQSGDSFARGEDSLARGEKGNKSRHEAAAGYVRLFLNFGKSDGLYPNQLLELVRQCVGEVRVGKIELREKFTFFEVEEKEAGRVMSGMSSFEVGGRMISVVQARPEAAGTGRRQSPGFPARGEKRGDKFKEGGKPWRDRRKGGA